MYKIIQHLRSTYRGLVQEWESKEEWPTLQLVRFYIGLLTHNMSNETLDRLSKNREEEEENEQH